MALFDILVNIAANTAKLESGLQQATQKLDNFANSIDRTFNRIASFAGIGLTMDVVAASIKHAVDSGNQLQLLSDRLGTSVTTLSRLQFAAALTDVPIEALTGSLDHFHTVITRAEIGSGRAGKALAAMGIDATKLLNLPLNLQLEAIADKLSKIQDPARRAGYEMIFFGETGAKLDPLFRQGAAGIRALEDEADKAGVTLDGSMTAKLKEAHEALVKMEAATHAAWLQIATNLSPGIQALAGWISGAVQGIRSFGETLAHYFGGADTLVGQLTDKITNLGAQSLRINTEMQYLEGRANSMIGHPGQFDTQIAAKKQQLAVIADEINRLTVLLAAAQKDADAAKAAADKGGSADIGKTPSVLGEVQIHGAEIYFDKMTHLTEQYQKDTQTETEKIVASWHKEEAELEGLRSQGLISAEEVLKRERELLDKYLPGVEVTGKRIKEKIEKETDAMQELGNRAASSIQGAFANFLFDPFHGGVKRMGIDFLTSLQKMASDAAAAQIFKALFGGVTGSGGSQEGGLGGILGGALKSAFGGGDSGGGLGGFLGGLFKGGGGGAAADQGLTNAVANPSVFDVSGMAGGGLVSAGSSYLVGEEGPELFTAASHGMITPNAALQSSAGDINITNHIDARGADADRIMTVLPPLFAQHGQRMKADILHAFRRNGLAAPVRA